MGDERVRRLPGNAAAAAQIAAGPHRQRVQRRWVAGKELGPGPPRALKTIAMANKLEPEGIKVSACSPGFIKTNFNNGTRELSRRVRASRCASLCSDGWFNGRFTRWENETIPW